MLEVIAALWFYALALTTSLFLAVVAVQGVSRQARQVLRALPRSAHVPVASTPPAPARVAA